MIVIFLVHRWSYVPVTVDDCYCWWIYNNNRACKSESVTALYLTFSLFVFLFQFGCGLPALHSSDASGAFMITSPPTAPCSSSSTPVTGAAITMAAPSAGTASDPRNTAVLTTNFSTVALADYRLCMRLSPSMQYFDIGIVVSVVNGV